MRGIVVIVLVAASGACLITQPPGDPPTAESRRPAILRDNVSPKLTEPLTVILPNTALEVPVESDPQSKLEWRLFLDFDPVNGGVQLLGDTIPQDQTLSATRIVTVPLFSLNEFDTGKCHTLTLRVAESFSTSSNWTPINPPGGDDATWFYRPGGNAAPCPGFDAGAFADAAAFDTGTE